jgi:hypothetical protein
MDKIKSKPGLLKFFNACPSSVRWYFEHLPKLIDTFPLDVALAYVFAQVESAQVMALYCGATKLHSVDKDIARRAMSTHHMTRSDFRTKFESIYGTPISDSTIKLANVAEAVRDRVMHGKEATDDDKRNAIAHALQYAIEMNDLTATLGGPRPFGDLRGFKGAAKALPKPTSRWVLKGMGFAV